jgi:ribonuclease HI
MTADERREVLVYCDGACRGNPGPGAFAAKLIGRGRQDEVTGVFRRTTNNRMELRAAIAAFETLKEPCRVTVVTDSKHVRNGMTRWLADWVRRGWRTSAKHKVKNRDLWERLLDLVRSHEVEWKWVRGHDGDVLNEHCDRVANEILDRLESGEVQAEEDRES